MPNTNIESKNLRGLPVLERFFAQVDMNGPVPEHAIELGPCWLWTGCLSRGYGGIRVHGKILKPHRVAYVIFIGPIPDGHEVDHLCWVTHCVNPIHLEAVTPLLNHQRANARMAYERDGHGRIIRRYIA